MPPINAPALFADTRLDRAQLFRPLFQDVQPAPVRSHLRGLRDRPAYTKLSLGRAMREGLDPTGRRLRSPMPRFALPDRDLANLIAYLEKLGARADPGVDDTWIRFASVVLPGVDPNAVAAMREVITSFVVRKNADIEGARDRPGYSPLYKSDLEPSYRLWSFDLWELEGASATWRSQLETRYREREVFALLGGVGTHAWQPVHDFCEAESVPCLFPTTPLPKTARPVAYTLYLSRGLIGEAEVLARVALEARRGLSTQTEGESGTGPTGGIVQVFRPGGPGDAAARAFRDAISRAGHTLRDVRWTTPEPPDPLFWRRIRGQPEPTVVVAWLGAPDLRAAPDDLPLLLSATLLGLEPAGRHDGRTDAADAAMTGAAWTQRSSIVYPYVLPGEEVPRSYRLRSWLRSRGIERRFERLQLNTLFALTVAEHALAHLVDRYSRDFFIERVEHETENALNPGVYPRLSLGPGQRFAAKGAQMVRIDAGTLVSVGEWRRDGP